MNVVDGYSMFCCDIWLDAKVFLDEVVDDQILEQVLAVGLLKDILMVFLYSSIFVEIKLQKYQRYTFRGMCPRKKLKIYYIT